MKVDPKNLAANFLTVLAVPFVVLLVLVLELLKALPISWLRQAARRFRFEEKLEPKPPTTKETFAPSRSWQQAMGDEIQFWDIANRQDRQRDLEEQDLPKARSRHPDPMELKEDDP